MRTVSLLLLLIGLSGCLSVPDRPTVDAAPRPTPPTPATATPVADNPAPVPVTQVQSPPATLWTRIRSGFTLPPLQHPRIDSEIRRLQSSPAHFDVLIGRAEPYLFHIVDAVEKRGLPAELALLPAVESSFRAYAYSPEGAAGLWQIMPTTGKALGLKQDWWFDGRRDLVSATDAALDYLERLNRRFDGNWLHALAAYNAGGGTVSRAIRKARQHNRSTAFWDLDLPGETDSYVPRLLALVQIIRDPGRFGLALPDIDNTPYFAQVASGGQIDLKVAAGLAGMDVEDLLLLNPGFRRWATAPEGPHRLLLPLDRVQAFQAGLATLPEEERLRWQRHRIARGDNLGAIARRYGVSVQAIMVANKLDNHLIRAGRALMIPMSESVALEGGNRPAIPRSRVRYRVRQGDSLYKIARKFRVKIADLERWNRLGRYLQPGEHLTVFVDADSLTL